MKVNDIKLIVSDIDGTLITDNDEISKDFKKMIDLLNEQGIVFAAASGRGVFSIKNKLDYDADNIYILSDNGAVIMHHDEVLETKHFDAHSYRDIIDTLTQISDIIIAATTPYDTYVMTNNPEINDRFLYEFYNKYTLVKNLTTIDEAIVGINIHCRYGSREILELESVKNLKGDFDIIQSGDAWIDILPSGSNKGLAVERLCKILNITMDQVIAFGDYNNDIEMIRSVKKGFAMEDATKELKAVADEVIGSNNDHSVIKKIMEIISNE